MRSSPLRPSPSTRSHNLDVLTLLRVFVGFTRGDCGVCSTRLLCERTWSDASGRCLVSQSSMVRCGQIVIGPAGSGKAIPHSRNNR